MMSLPREGDYTHPPRGGPRYADVVPSRRSGSTLYWRVCTRIDLNYLVMYNTEPLERRRGIDRPAKLLAFVETLSSRMENQG